MKKPLLIMNLAVGLFAVSAQGHSFDVAALVRDFVSDLSRLSEEQIHAVAQEDGAALTKSLTPRNEAVKSLCSSVAAFGTRPSRQNANPIIRTRYRHFEKP